MSEFRRRLMMASKTKPYDAEVEYLESSGTQWIDTGIYGDFSLDFEVKAMRVGSATYQNVFGDRLSSTSRRYSLMNSNNYANFNAGDSNEVAVNAGNTKTWHTYKKTSADCYIDNTKKGSLATQTFTTPNTIILFGARNDGTLSSPYSGRIEFCKFYRNNIVIADFIAVRKGTVGYMYDKVSGELFGNDGTGSFTYGNDKNS